ncbi:CBS domain-containing protein [Terrihabitans sp. B22-R8]|uniref:CBS domain-containing protein n=1 Tax=Terrihabitans sp. B22-R8 TaxID=3425128 RepID=UPI00403D2CCB
MFVSTILEGKGNSVVTVDPDCTLEEASRLLAKHRIGAVVVTDPDGGIQGMLSERDIVRSIAQAGAAALDNAVSDHMTRAVQVTSPEEPIHSIMEQMTEGRFRHLPVVSNARMIGIVSIGDVVKQRLAHIEAEASAMRDYIASA